MEIEALLSTQTAFLALGFVLEDLAEFLEHVAALVGEVCNLVDDVPPTVGQAVDLDDSVSRRQIAIERVAHEHWRRQRGVALLHERREILTGVLATAEEEHDRTIGGDGDDAGGEQAAALRVLELTSGEQLGPAASHEIEDPDRWVVVVQQRALSRPALELLVAGLERCSVISTDLPLRGRGARRLEVSLETVESVEPHPATVAEQGHHAGGGFVVLRSSRLLRGV